MNNVLENNKQVVNKAIEVDDLIYVDDLLVRPQGITDNILEYMNLVTLSYEFCDLNTTTVKGYENA